MAALERLGFGSERSDEAAFFATRLRVQAGDENRARSALRRWESRGVPPDEVPSVVDTAEEPRRLAGLGLVLARVGLTREAEELASRVVRLPPSASLGLLHARAVAFRALGMISLDRGEGPAALVYLRESERSSAQARDIQRASFEAMQQEPAAGLFEELGRALQVAVPYSEQAEFATLQGRAQALAGDPLKAVERYARAVEIIESLRRFLDLGDRQRFFEGRTGPYKGMVGTLLSLEGKARGRNLRLSEARGANSTEMAFYFAEAARARTFGERLAQAQRRESEPSLPAELAGRERELRARVAAELLRGIPYQESDAYRQLRALVGELRQTHPRYAALQYPVPVIPSEIPLRPGETLLAYAVLDTGAVAWLVQPGRQVHVYRSSVSTDRLMAAVRRLRSSLVPGPGGRLPPFDTRASELLYEWLLAEPMKMVPRGSALLIVPDGFLATVPFEVFRGRSASGPMEYAGDQVRITYHPSATVLSYERRFGRRSRQEGPEGAGRLLVLADPIYDAHDARTQGGGLPAGVQASVPREAALQAFASGFGGSGFRRLAWTAREARLLSAALPGRTDVRLGRAANEHLVKALDLREYRYLHFATHGVLAGDIPYLRQPALVLTLVGDLQGEDGFLTMNEVTGLELQAEVTVLSACETGLGEEVSGEGVVGLTRAFLLAGSRAVVASLWKIDDAAASELMGLVYRYLSQGERPDVALSKARQDLRADPTGRLAHPFYWAAFVLYGSTRKSTSEQPAN